MNNNNYGRKAKNNTYQVQGFGIIFKKKANEMNLNKSMDHPYPHWFADKTYGQPREPDRSMYKKAFQGRQ